MTKISEETFVLDMTPASGSEALRLKLLVVVSTFSIAEFWWSFASLFHIHSFILFTCNEFSKVGEILQPEWDPKWIHDKLGLVEVTKWFPQNVSLHFLKIHFKTLQIAAKHFKTIQNTTSAASRKMRSMTGFHYQKYKIFQNKQFQTKMNATIELGPQMVLTHHSAVIIFNSKITLKHSKTWL